MQKMKQKTSPRPLFVFQINAFYNLKTSEHLSFNIFW